MSAGYSRKKPALDLGCLDGMSMPIRRTPITREYRKTLKVRLYNRQWHAKHYVPRPSMESEPDTLEKAEIEVRAAQIRREKFLYWCCTGRKT